MAALYGVKPKGEHCEPMQLLCSSKCVRKSSSPNFFSNELFRTEYGPTNRPVHQKNAIKEEVEEKKVEEKPEVTSVQLDSMKTQEQLEHTEPDYNAPEYWDEDTTPEGYTYYWNTQTRGLICGKSAPNLLSESNSGRRFVSAF